MARIPLIDSIRELFTGRDIVKKTDVVEKKFVSGFELQKMADDTNEPLVVHLVDGQTVTITPQAERITQEFAPW
jgi:hypothetical protein